MVTVTQSYGYANTALIPTVPDTSTPNRNDFYDELPDNKLVAHVVLNLPTMQLLVYPQTGILPYGPAFCTVEFNGNTYTIPSPFTNPVVINGPFSDPAGGITLTYYETGADNGFSLGEVHGFPPVMVYPQGFAVPSPTPLYGYIPNGFDYSQNACVLNDGWLTFEKSFGFESAVSVIKVNGIDYDGDFSPGDIYEGFNIEKNNGMYIPDYISLNKLRAYLQVSAMDGFSPLLKIIYPQNVVEDIVTAQIPTIALNAIKPTASKNTTIVDGYIHQKLGTVDSVTAHGHAEVLMPDGTTRRIVSKVLSGGFDLYSASRAGVTLMFTDLWNDTYHGAQLGYLLDGTLVSYAWKITNFAGDDDNPAGIRYSLYFKRSLNDGASWEIQQTVVENLEQISGLPLLTQNTVTGRIAIGNKYSDDMGLTWH